jgi:hypothetical protein
MASIIKTSIKIAPRDGAPAPQLDPQPEDLPF